MDPATIKRRLLRFILDYCLFIVVLVVGLYVWTTVFNTALADYLDTSAWNMRSVWTGDGTFDLFGYSVTVQFEGYSDYSFYYVHWGHNMLNGVLPYCPEFGVLEMDGIVNRNGLYIFPPLYAVLYAAGIMIPVDNWGIGLLLSVFGYLTVFPVYGIAKELSDNRRVGEAAALTYLLSPNVLYHVTFVWMNLSPVVFFWFSGFYMLLRRHRHIGTLLIVTAALFKQIAWFMGLPLVVYLLLRPHPPSSEEGPVSEDSTAAEVAGADTAESDSGDEAGAGAGDATVTVEGDTQPGTVARIAEWVNQYVDVRGFLFSVVLVIIYAGAVLLPFIIAQHDTMLDYMMLAAGGFPLDSFVDPPEYASPMRFQVLAVVAGAPELAAFLNGLIYSGFLLWAGVLTMVGLMLIEPREEGRHTEYLRRLLFMTMVLMLWVHLMGPRGVYKYYFVLFAPFFSVFSSSRMVTSRERHVPFSASMLWLPFVFSLMIVVPPRNIYLVGVTIILVGYLLASRVGLAWRLVKSPATWLRRRLAPRAAGLVAWYAGLRARVLSAAAPPQDTGLPTAEDTSGPEGA